MQVLSYNEAAAKAGIVRRTLERLISIGEGPAVIEISSRRRGVMESDLEQWLNARRRVPPGFKESAERRSPNTSEPSAA
jgi:predicted DNA-binding transcriptional regulator AlpA